MNSSAATPLSKYHMLLLNRIPRPVLSFACQGMVSGISFIASFLLLHYADKSEYTTFVLFLNGYALLASLQNALWLQPLITLSGNMQAAVKQDAIKFGIWLSLAIALLGGVLFAGYRQFSQGSTWLSLSTLLFASSFLFLLVRDSNRSAWLMLGKLPGLFVHDMGYLLLFGVLVAVAWYAQWLSMNLVIVALAFPGLMSLFARPRPDPERKEGSIQQLDRQFAAQIWSCARWALPGVLVTWLFSNGYWFYLDSVQGKAQVATLAATRLFFTPVGLMVQGWAGYYRPVFSRLEHMGEHQAKLALVRRQSLICAALVLLFVVGLLLLVLAPSVLPAYLTPAVYIPLVLAWGGYFLVQWLRNILSTALLADAKGYKRVFQSGLVGAIVFYLIYVPVGLVSHLLVLCPLILCFSEITILVLLWRQVFGGRKHV